MSVLTVVAAVAAVFRLQEEANVVTEDLRLALCSSSEGKSGITGNGASRSFLRFSRLSNAQSQHAGIGPEETVVLVATMISGFAAGSGSHPSRRRGKEYGPAMTGKHEESTTKK